MTYGVKARSAAAAAGLAIAAAVMGGIASRTWGAERVEPRDGTARPRRRRFRLLVRAGALGTVSACATTSLSGAGRLLWHVWDCN